MSVTVRALQALSHDGLSLARGQEGEVSEATAADLQAKGLVVLADGGDSKKTEPDKKAAALPSDKMAPPTKNKSR